MEFAKTHGRYNWVDISKGFVICLMVIGHSSLPPIVGRWIWSFHMPFFFFISALCTNWERGGFNEFIRRKAKILLVPFTIYSAINLALLPFALDVAPWDYLIQTICHGWGGIALWFVPVFFLSLTICKAIPQKQTFISGFLMLVVGSLLSLDKIELPWAMASVPFGAALMLFTRYFQASFRSWTVFMGTLGWIMAMMTGLIVSIFISHFYRLDMCCNMITPTIPILAGICGGIIFSVGLAHLLDKMGLISSVFSHIGHNTYEIMALSQAPIMISNMFIPHLTVAKYAIMIVFLILAVYVRKMIEGKFSKVEAI